MAIGIIGAMKEEVEILKQQMTDPVIYKRGGSTFFSGKLDGKDVVLLQCGIGKVNASIGTTMLILRYKPMCIINTGSAGGFSEDLEIGDVIISSEVIHHDVDVTAFGYEYGQVPNMPDAFLPHNNLVNIAEKAAEMQKGLNIRKGVIATGDSFMDDSEEIRKLKERFPAVAAAEMEAAAIAQTCYQFRKPFVVIRSISDIAGKDSAVSFESFLEKAAKNSAKMVIDIISELSDYTFKKERERAIAALDG